MEKIFRQTSEFSSYRLLNSKRTIIIIQSGPMIYNHSNERQLSLSKTLTGKIKLKDIKSICSETEYDNHLKKELYSCIYNHDDRVSYNALWVFTHFSAANRKWLLSKRDELTDLLLNTKHTGKKRLILTLLEKQPVNKNNIRPDFLDFCLSKINSTEPYAIRALCLKQAFKQCKFYPELMKELLSEMEMTEYGEMSPGLMSALRKIRKEISHNAL